MNSDQKSKIYNEGVKSCKKHSTMSKETAKCINLIQQDMVRTKEELKYIKQRLQDIPTRDEMRADNLELVSKIMEESDKRYSSKNAEKVVLFIVSLMGVFVINSLLELI
jgi:hypothetical protein